MVFSHPPFYLVAFFFFIVLIHRVHTFIFFPPIVFICKLIYCLFTVLMLEWERLASFFDPRPHTSHFLAMIVKIQNSKYQISNKL